MTWSEPTRSRGGHLLRALLVLAPFTGGPGFPATARSAERVFIVTASRYEFVPDLLEVDVGDRVRIALQSDDVSHGFSIEGYGIDVTLPATGEAVLVELVADRPGTFEFTCSDYCGVGHADMRGRLVVREAPSPGIEARRPQIVDRERVERIDTDYTVVNIPTTLELPRHQLAFWVTHRFARPLGEGSFGDLAQDLFALDGGAQIGLGLRFGVTSAAQVAFYRTSDRTLQIFGQYRIAQQDEAPFGLALSASVEGLNNFSESYSPAFSAILSRRLGDRVALYAAPAWVGNTNLSDVENAGDDTVVLGVGARLRLSERVYVVGEFSPRLAGFDQLPSGRTSVALASFGVELRYGGHLFQLNVSNDLATTPAQLARGQRGPDGWFLGFNISRKFF